MPIDGLAERCEEAASVLVVKEDLLSCVAATGDVVDGSLELDTEGSCHDVRSPVCLNSNIKL